MARQDRGSIPLSNEERRVIKWPDRYHPSLAPVHVVNELTIPAPCEQVWPWLIRAPLWPLWYPNSSDVRLVDRPLSELRLGTMFTWRTFGVKVKSTVQEFIPNERMAWSARGLGVDAYHAWLLTPCASGTRVITEETQYGTLARLQKLFLPGRMKRGHQLWLENLSAKVQSGPPP
jgi:uncharacterized protein YndB with AHSA1/START domain